MKGKAAVVKGVAVGPLALVLMLGVGCSTTVPAPAPPPAPDIGAFLPSNYRVVSTASVALEPLPHPADLVVVSAGPGQVRGTPVAGGTEDVQVLSYDAVAKRWNLAFDAAQKVVPAGYRRQLDAVSGDAGALLQQSDTITGAQTLQVQFGKGTPDLVVYGVDSSTNHPSGELAVVDFGSGTASVVYYGSAVDMSAPQAVGDAGAQHVKVTADFATPIDPACCPVRQYTQVIGAVRGEHADPRAVGVVEDDRPWLGAWYVTPAGEQDGRAVVVGTADGSPASAALRAGDRLVSVAGTTLPSGDVYQPAVVDQVAVHRPSDRVDLVVVREGARLTVPITLSSRGVQAYAAAAAPQQAVIGVQIMDAPSGGPHGALVGATTSGSPAERAGISAGDRITALGPMPVQSATDAQVALMGQANKTLAIVVWHPGGQSETLSITPWPEPVPPTGSGLVAQGL